MASTKVELVKELEDIVAQREKIGVKDNGKFLALIKRAKEGYYHDFETPIATPKVELVKDLREIKLGLTDKLAQRVIEGEFDE